jgi:hypothetical protein
MNRKKLKMSRLIKRDEDDNMFDIEFWQKLGSLARFNATWEMVVNYELNQGKTYAELRLDRSITNLKQKQN